MEKDHEGNSDGGLRRTAVWTARHVCACSQKFVEALSTVNYRPVRNEERCIGCGECVLNCPTRAWTRSRGKYYRLALFGRSGKKNPRRGEDFIKWADEDSIVKIILNTYD